MLIYERDFGSTWEMRAFEILNIEQELSLWLYLQQRSGCAQGLAYPFSVVTLLHFLESLSWNRKSDVLFAGLSAWEVSDCVWEMCFFCCLWCDKLWVMVCRHAMTLGPSRFLFFRFDLISTLTCSHHLSTVLEWKFSHLSFSVWLLCDSVACSSFLCLTTVW